MLNISIGSENAVVQNPATYSQWTVKTTEIFGTVYATLERHFCHIPQDELPEKIAERIWKRIRGEADENEAWIFHVKEIGTHYFDLKSFIDDRETIVPTLKEIEEMRIRYSMTSNYLPVQFGDQDSMRFEKLASVTQVMIAILYYYAFNGYKLVRCKHCGKWFATKTLKEKYCKRISPCFGEIITGKTPLPCEQAVRNIKQKQSRRRRNIYEYLCNYATYQEEIDEFKEQCKRFREAITNAPTVKNFQEYEAFLDRYPKRMVKR